MIGYLMIALAFIGLFLLIIKIDEWETAIKVFLFSFGLLGWAALAVYFIAIGV